MTTRPAKRCVFYGDLIVESENCYTRQDHQLIKLIMISVKKCCGLYVLTLSLSFFLYFLSLLHLLSIKKKRKGKTMPLSVIPSSFTPPVSPDFHHCNTYFAGNNSLSMLDCQLAFNQLPVGSQAEAWYSLPPEWEHAGLPHVVSEGQHFVSKLIS